MAYLLVGLILAFLAVSIFTLTWEYRRSGDMQRILYYVVAMIVSWIIVLGLLFTAWTSIS